MTTAQRPAPMLARVRAASLAVIALATGLWLAAHHPLSAAVALAGFAILVAAAARFPFTGLIALPALLPVLAFAPWSGWQGVEEIDLLVLAIAAGGYARQASTPPLPRAAATSALVGLMLLLATASLLFSMQRGVADAGGWRLGWYQGLNEPLAAVRLAKSFLEALLLWPLWRYALRRAPPGAGTSALSGGLALGLVAASLAALWERLAFTDLLNFSTDYRTTALFWEMQVGGAAFDGFLGLTVPFALRELMVARGRLRWTLAAAGLMLGAYACLTTFSRGVYLGVPVGLAVMMTLELARRRRDAPTAAPLAGVPIGSGLVVAFLAVAAWMFPGSGYRGMLALVGACAVLLPLGPVLARMPRNGWLGGTALGIVLSGLGLASPLLLPKGAYVGFAAAVGFTFAALAWHRLSAGRSLVAAALGWAGFLWVVTGVGVVAQYWGGEPALYRALPAVFVLLAAALGSGIAGRGSRALPWPEAWRWQGGVLATMVLAGSVVGVMSGGDYMSGRFSTSGGDLDGRRHHWRAGLALLRDPMQWAFGIGLGRFPAQFALAAPEKARPGDYRLLSDAEGPRLVIASGTHVNGWGELFRVSQRISPPRGATHVELLLRSAQAVELHVDVCAKHLLYNGACLIGRVTVPAPKQPGAWQSVQFPLQGATPTRGPAYAPRLIAFSLGVDSSGQRAEFRRVALVDASGENLLANSDFSRGLAHWFSSSDRHHLPWHAKNMALHVLIEHGAVGLVLLALLLGGAAWRVSAGHARDHALAPPIAGALAGFFIVGLTDSLLDAPRVALLYHLLVLTALTLTPPSRPEA